MAKKEVILQECMAFMEENNIGYSEYTENDEVVGIEFETWTDGGVDMIQFIDGRNKDMEDPDWWKAELTEIYNNFDVDEEIELHRQGESYRNAFTIRQSVEDFEDYQKWLEDIAIKANAT